MILIRFLKNLLYNVKRLTTPSYGSYCIILNQFKASDGLSHRKIHFVIFHRTEYNMFECLCCLLCCIIEATQTIYRTDFILNALQWMHHSAYVHIISDWIFGTHNSKLNEISVFSQISPFASNYTSLWSSFISMICWCSTCK